ncbi:NosD domain-containing protein [Nitriliruptor alkaliphilus]|uniref:NosD domain-containing protein n=1 Tax=Nitriliruptor alkaliphilus TaxID=427918 RepID=UPI000698ECAD|nr:NosD domain-containing protein [Nitriliruptor alkaliphilus]
MTTSDSSSAAGAPLRATRLGRGVSIALGSIAALLVGVGGWFLPLWQATLYAPQYPGGLRTIAWGHDVGGDLNEVNALNHYVGLGVFDPNDVPEMALWPLALVAGVVATLLAVLVARRWVRRLGLLYLWTLPVAVLGATQYRLHEFGQDVAPGAAFRMEPFTPWVVGRTTVWNFETWAWPGLGLGAIVLAAVLVTFGPRLLSGRALVDDGGDGPGDGGRIAGSDRTVSAVTMVALLVVAGSVTITGPAQAQDHGHGGHDHAGHDDPGGAGNADDRGAPAPEVGPAGHPAMPRVIEHPVIGDLAELVEATAPGGTLRLHAGTYTGPVVIDEPIVIEGSGLPIILGDGVGSVITVRAPGTEIRGVVVRGSGGGPTGDPAGIRIEADDVTVSGVVIDDSYIGIAVDTASDVRIEDNHIHGRAGAAIVDEGHAVADDDDVDDAAGGGASFSPHGDHADHAGHAGHADHAGHDHPAPAATFRGARGDGIWLHDADHVLIRGNHVQHARDGVFVSFGSGALLDGNHLHASRYAVHSMFARDLALVQNHVVDNLSGVVLMYGGEVLLLRNHIEGNVSPSTGFAIILKDVTDVEAVQNVLVGNRVGIHLDGPVESTNETIFKANTVARNTVGVQVLSTARASFAGNSFAANTTQALSLGTNNVHIAWAAEGWGNYWSTYRGYDALGHGRGAVAHSEGGSVDRLLARNPELIAIAGSPAMQLLRSVEERWGQRDPVLTDELPLTVPVSPALAATSPDPTARAIGSLLGVTLVLPALVAFSRRRPSRVPARSRRSVRAISV